MQPSNGMSMPSPSTTQGPSTLQQGGGNNSTDSESPRSHPSSPARRRSQPPPKAQRDVTQRPVTSAFGPPVTSIADPRLRVATTDASKTTTSEADPLAVTLPVLPPVSRYRGFRRQAGSMAIRGSSGNRRQGVVFEDSFSDSSHERTASVSAVPPAPHRHRRNHSQQQDQLPQRRAGSSKTRQRSKAALLDSTFPDGLLTVDTDQRPRRGSIGSFGPSAPLLEAQKLPLSASESWSRSSSPSSRPSDPSTAPYKTKSAKSGSSKRLVKRQSSCATSPVTAVIASVDSLSTPVAVGKPSKLVSLMKALNGRMRGEIECRGGAGGSWYSGYAYIDVDGEQSRLIFNLAKDGVSFTPLVSDLRGCIVLPAKCAESGKECLQVAAANDPAAESTLLLRPIPINEQDLWFAALLCWQQVRPAAGLKPSNSSCYSLNASVELIPSFGPSQTYPGQSPLESTGISSIIKVGTIMVWDKGPPATPRDVFSRSSSRSGKQRTSAWRRVSCILHDNGEFKLLTENDSTVLSIIQLTQLSRRAIQRLDRTVLDEEYCISILPMYASASTQLSVIRPIYLALDGRIQFEVWFVLLRAFAVPDVYQLENPAENSIKEVTDSDIDARLETFRIEKSIDIRVTEAKVKSSSTAGPEAPAADKGQKQEPDALVGNYLAEVMLNGEMRARTATRPATKNPFWREDCTLVDLQPTVRDLSILLKRADGGGQDSDGGGGSSGRSKSADGREVLCGSVSIDLDELESGKDHEKWFPIMDSKQQQIGTMLVKISHAEHAVLLAKEYEPLTELLHRFSTGLTTLVSAALPGHLRRLSEMFLNIFQASGSAADWLMALAEDEIDGAGNQASARKMRFNNRLKSNDSTELVGDREVMVRDLSKTLAGEANLLFRGNSLLTQSLEFHMRRLGSEYLEDVLQEKIAEISELDPDCEVDPSKAPQAVGAELEQRWDRLVQLTTEVWKCIADSADQIPAELRHILKYIRAVAEDRYGDFLRTVSYTAVSGFLFLRFICPAILSPKLFGLVRDHPRPRAQRTLTLIAKALQKMSNMSTFGKREEWMEPMNKFLMTQRPVFREYIDHVCGIPTQRGTQTVPAGYSTPMAMLGRLGTTAREGFPSLPYLIDQGKSCAALVKLWVDSCPSDIRDDQPEADLHLFNDLCTGLQARADACLATVERIRATGAAPFALEPVAETPEQAILIETLGALSASPLPLDADSAGSDGVDSPNSQRRSKEWRRKRDDAEGSKKAGTGSAKGKNGKVSRTILNGIMRIGGRADSPDARAQK